MYKNRNPHRSRQADTRKADLQTDRQPGTQADTDRQTTDKQTYKQTHDTHADNQTVLPSPPTIQAGPDGL